MNDSLGSQSTGTDLPCHPPAQAALMQGMGRCKWEGCTRHRGDKEKQGLRAADLQGTVDKPSAVSQSTFPFSDNTPSTDEVFNNQEHIYFGFWNNLQLLISTFSE